MYERELVKLKNGSVKDTSIDQELGLGDLGSVLKQKLNELSANRRLVIGDAAAAAISVVLAVVLANGGTLPEGGAAALAPLAIMSCLVALAILPMSGLYKRHTRSTSLRDVFLIVRASFLCVGAMALLGMSVLMTSTVPMAVLRNSVLPDCSGIRQPARFCSQHRVPPQGACLRGAVHRKDPCDPGRHRCQL